MRRTLHVPVVDLRVGDTVIAPGGSSKAESKPFQILTVTESQWGEDKDGSYYIAFDDDLWTQYCSPVTQYSLLLEM